MTRHWPTKETEVAAPVVEWLQAAGWDVYQEVRQRRVIRCSCDIIATRESLVWAIEASVRFNANEALPIRALHDQEGGDMRLDAQQIAVLQLLGVLDENEERPDTDGNTGSMVFDDRADGYYNLLEKLRGYLSDSECRL